MADQAETEAVARKIREFAMELERDGYPAAAITDGMLMVALDAAHKMAGPHHLAKFLSKLARRFQMEADETQGGALHWGAFYEIPFGAALSGPQP
jgi:hypothetical protein